MDDQPVEGHRVDERLQRRARRAHRPGHVDRAAPGRRAEIGVADIGEDLPRAVVDDERGQGRLRVERRRLAPQQRLDLALQQRRRWCVRTTAWRGSPSRSARARCGAWNGSAARRVGTGSAAASARVSPEITPAAAIRRSTASRASCAPLPGGGRAAAARASAGWRPAAPPRPRSDAPAPCRNRPGWRRAPLRDCRRTAPGSGRGRGSRPCRAAAPAPAPRRFRRASPVSVRGRRSSRRTACIVRVEAPETTWPCTASCTAARARGERVDPEMAAQNGDPRWRSASGDRADRPRSPPSAVATCRRRRETRAGSTRRAPAPAATGAALRSSAGGGSRK